MEYFFAGAIDGAWNLLVAPFADFAFMRRALVATLALSLSAAPLGVFLTLRRMSLLGKEDASLAALYLVALAIGVTLISSHGTQFDLLHILFGSALGVETPGLLLVAAVASVSVVVLAAAYRGLVLESFDPVFLSVTGQRGARTGPNWIWQQGFLMRVVVNLVAGFQTLGTLMAVGLMRLPAVSARLWHDTLPAQLVNASAQAMLAGYFGLLLSYHLNTPSGATIIGCAGALYALSLLASPGGWLPRQLARSHRVA